MAITDGRKILPLDQAIWLCREAAKEVDSHITPSEEKMLHLVVESCPIVEADGRQFVRLMDLNAFIANLLKAIAEKDSSFLTQRRGLAVDRVVDVEEFVCSSEYMGQKGYVRPLVLKGLIELFQPEKYVECCLSGSVSWGKTYFAEMAMAYLVYLLSCYHSPQAEFDLAPGSSIVFIQQSKSYNLAKKVVFDQFLQRLKESPYFLKSFAPDPYVKSELRFPKNISVLPVGGADTAALGMTVWGGIIDELNFMARIRKSENTRFTGEEEYDQAQKVYNVLSRRMKTRFIQADGKIPGKLILVSSVNYPGDFTSRKQEESKTDETLLFLSHNAWEVLPSDRVSSTNFLIEIGSDNRRSRVISDRSEARDDATVIEVPDTYRSEFDKDLEGALRDVAGIVSGVKNPFIPNREGLAGAVEDFVSITEDMQLFLHNSVCLNHLLDPDFPHWEDLVNMDYIEQCLLERDTAFAAHIDVGLTQDAAGLAVGHISGYRILPVAKVFNDRTQSFTEVKDIRSPIFQVDGALQIVSPRRGEEIDLLMLQNLVVWLQGVINLKWATVDSYQSAQMIQAFRRVKIRSGVLSVDTSIAPYNELKVAVNEGRILLPNNPILSRELRELERDAKKDKVDHPAGGTKDIGDSVAGVCYILGHKEADYGRPVQSRRRSEIVQEATNQRRRVRKIRVSGPEPSSRWTGRNRLR